MILKFSNTCASPLGVNLSFCPTFIHLSLTLLQCFCTFLKFQDVYILFSVRGSRPGKNVQLTENEIRGLCLKSRELFLSQPILLELEAPLKICGELNLTLPFINHIIMACAIFILSWWNCGKYIHVFRLGLGIDLFNLNNGKFSFKPHFIAM